MNDFSAQWRQGWLSGMIVVEWSQHVNGIVTRGKMILHSGAILEIEGTQSGIMIQTFMLLNGLQSVKWNNQLLTLDLANKKPKVRTSNIRDDVMLDKWIVPIRPIPYRELHVMIGQQNPTDYSWYTSNEYGALRLQKDQKSDDLRVTDIIGPTLLCTNSLPCALDMVIALLMVMNGKLIRAKDARSILLPGKSRDVLEKKEMNENQDARLKKVELVELLYAGRGY